MYRNSVRYTEFGEIEYNNNSDDSSGSYDSEPETSTMKNFLEDYPQTPNNVPNRPSAPRDDLLNAYDDLLRKFVDIKVFLKQIKEHDNPTTVISCMDREIEIFHTILEHMDIINDQQQQHIQNSIEVIENYYIVCVEALKNIFNDFDDFEKTLKITNADNYLITEFNELCIKKDKILSVVSKNDEKCAKYIKEVESAYSYLYKKMNELSHNETSHDNGVISAQENLFAKLKVIVDSYKNKQSLELLKNYELICTEYDRLKVLYDETEELIVQFNELVITDTLNCLGSESLDKIKDGLIIASKKIYDPASCKFVIVSYHAKVNHVLKSLYKKMIYFHAIYFNMDTLHVSIVYAGYKEYWNYVRSGNKKLNIDLKQACTKYIQYMMDLINSELQRQHKTNIFSPTLVTLLKEFYRIEEYNLNDNSITEIKSMQYIKMYLERVEEQLKKTGFLGKHASLDSYVYK